jgi:hypothetical protein
LRGAIRPTGPDLDDLFLEVGRGVSGDSQDIEDDLLMARACETLFDDLEPFAVLRTDEIAGRLGVTGRSVRRSILRGELMASRACGLRVLAADAAAWSTENVVVRGEPERFGSRPTQAPRARTQPRRSPRLVREPLDRLPLPPRPYDAAA